MSEAHIKHLLCQKDTELQHQQYVQTETRQEDQGAGGQIWTQAEPLISFKLI